jgi:hypothetical protein
MNRRDFAAAAAAATWGLAGRTRAPASPAGEPGALAGWSLRATRRMKVATGTPRHRAFPGIEKLRNGDLLVAYREGSDHWRTADGQVRLVRSKDNGLTWSEPQTVLAKDGVNYGTHSGICQLSDGTILMPAQYLDKSWGPEHSRYAAFGDTSGQGPRRIVSYLLRSSDDGRTWSAPESPEVDGLASDYWWNVYGKFFQVENSSTVLWPITRQKKGEVPWRTGLLVSRDVGRTWTEYRDTAVGLADEKNLIRLSGGHLLTVIRDLKPPYVLHQTESKDDGMNWLPYSSTGFLGHCPALLRTPKGVLLCTHRIVDPGNTPGVGLHYSFDDGVTWHAGDPVYVSPDPSNRDCSYASLVQLDPRRVLCVYYTTFIDRNCDIEGVILEES